MAAIVIALSATEGDAPTSAGSENFTAAYNLGPCYYGATQLNLAEEQDYTAPVEITWWLRRKGYLPPVEPE